MDLDSVRDELYAAVPSRFVAIRDERAAAARRAGDLALAASIKKLRRPTVGAWLANLLVRERRSEVEQLLELGEALRRAQHELAGEAVRRLSHERHQLVERLAAEAAARAGELADGVSEASLRELEATLGAAVVDVGAAAALREGRLTAPLRYAGFGPLGSADAFPRRPRAARAGTMTASSTHAERSDSPLGVRRQRGARQLEQAKAASVHAEAVRRTAEEAVASARKARDEAQRHVEHVSEQLKKARLDEQSAERELVRAERALHVAEQRAEEAAERERLAARVAGEVDGSV